MLTVLIYPDRAAKLSQSIIWTEYVLRSVMAVSFTIGHQAMHGIFAAILKQLHPKQQATFLAKVLLLH
jgi:hypothetical protein